MAGNDIANKVKAGLNKASVKTGDGSSAIYLNKKVYSAGDPINPPTETVTKILLINAITKTINKYLIDDDLIRSGDISLVSNGDVEILQNDEIDINGKIYAVISVDIKKPSNVPLAYISQIRSQ
jgi:hypothetical protein